jgi:putative spermidine/putrescine transport system permease protein
VDAGLDEHPRLTEQSGNGVAAPRNQRISAFFYRHSRLRLGGLLSAPLLWLFVLYLGSLAVLLVSSFWSTDSFTGNLIREGTLANYQTLLTQSVYRTVALRTVGMAVAVTVVDLVLGMTLAFFASKVVRTKPARYALIIMITLPLWASYLVKGYAWRITLEQGGVLDWLLRPFGLHGPGLGIPATTLALAYLWLPYMTLPIFAGLERIPQSLLDASSDLGAPAWRTLRTIVFPLILPAIAAGSIFTFSLTLGDYIMVQIVGSSSQMFANIIYDNIGVADNLPLAAAAAMFPIAVVLLYLALVRRSGALENL